MCVFFRYTKSFTVPSYFRVITVYRKGRELSLSSSYVNLIAVPEFLMFWCAAELRSPEDFSAVEVFNILLYILYMGKEVVTNWLCLYKANHWSTHDVTLKPNSD